MPLCRYQRLVLKARLSVGKTIDSSCTVNWGFSIIRAHKYNGASAIIRATTNGWGTHNDYTGASSAELSGHDDIAFEVGRCTVLRYAHCIRFSFPLLALCPRFTLNLPLV